MSPQSFVRRSMLFSVTAAMIFSPAIAEERTAKRFANANPNCAQGDQACGLRGVFGMPATFGLTLAKTGSPLWHTVDKAEGQTMEQVVEELCGSQANSVSNYILDEAKSLNFAEQPKRLLQLGEMVAIPYCLKVEQNVPVVVQAGDTPEKILRREYGVHGKETIKDFYRHNRGSYLSFSQFERGLRIGDTVTVPYQSQERIFVPASLSTLSFAATGPDRGPAAVASEASEYLPAAIIESISIDKTRILVAVASRPAGQTETPKGPDLRFVNRVDFSGANQAQITACLTSGSHELKIADLLDLRKQIAQQLHMRAKWTNGDPALPVVTGVIDSGLSYVGDGFFDEKFFRDTSKEVNGLEGHDDDGNGYTDDLYGININRVGTLRSHSIDYRSHGSEIAALVLGGPTLFPDWTKGIDHPPIKLRIVNFSAPISIRPNGVASPELMPTAVRHLIEKKASIINFSLVTKDQLPMLQSLFETYKVSTLMVVAAGNAERGGGRNIELPMLYPAAFGSPKRNGNVLTVGAYDLSLKRASFSHHSNEFVALLAPGCSIRTRDDQGNPLRSHGTSIATAVTSFAAGLIKYLSDDLPAVDVRNRLIVGTDYDPDLEDYVYSSGRLNIIKSISLFNDVVETDDAVTPMFGRIAEPDLILTACIVPPLVGDSPLRKAIPNQGDGDQKAILLWYESGKAIVKKECVQKEANTSIGAIEIDGKTTQLPTLSSIKEIVYSHYRKN